MAGSRATKTIRNIGKLWFVNRARKAAEKRNAEVINCPITTGSSRNRRFLSICPITGDVGLGAGTVSLAAPEAHIIRLGAMKIVNLQGTECPQLV